MKEILFIEDDKLLNHGISMGLEREGYGVTSGFSVEDARREIASGRHFDLLLLDANLPDGDGFTLCREICGNTTMPVILLTARGMDCDMVGGLAAGADDYIVKPVSIRVLTARIQALLRRIGNGGSSDYYRKGPFNFDFKGGIFLRNGVALKLGRREQKLLAYLVSNANRALSREQILVYVWSDERVFVEDNALSVRIRRLREKLEADPAQPEYVKNVYGIGYIWTDGNGMVGAISDIKETPNPKNSWKSQTEEFEL